MANENYIEKEQFTITKRIAKHGNQAVIVIPSVLSQRIKPKMLVKVTIDLLDSNTDLDVEVRE